MLTKKPPTDLETRMRYLVSIGKMPNMMMWQECSGIPRSTFFYIVKGKTKTITLKHAKQMADTVGVSIDWLFFGVGEKPT